MVGKALFSFDGRITRADWLIYGSAVLVVAAALQIFGAGLIQALPPPVNPCLRYLAYGGDWRRCLLALPTAWPLLALSARRLHDRGWSAWWLLAMAALWYLPTGLGWLWSIVELGARDGTPGPNRYGPSPKGIAGSQAWDVFS